MKKNLQIAFGVALSAFLLWYLFRDVHWGQVLTAFREAHLGWLAAATALMFLTFVTRVKRWTYIVRTAKPVSFRAMFSATQIGFLGTFVLPLRAGEVIRAFVLARLGKIPFGKCMAFVALDRVTDIFGLLVVMGITAAAFHPKEDIVLPKHIYPAPVPANFVQQGMVLAGVFVVCVLAALILIYLRPRWVLGVMDACAGVVVRMAGLVSKGLARVLEELARRVHDMVEHFAEGMHILRSAPDMLRSVFFSLLVWFQAVLFLECVMSAFGVERPWYTGFLMQTAIAAAVSVPAAPGFIGLYHAAVILALTAVSGAVDEERASAIAIMAHLLNLIPVVIVGLVCLKMESLGLIALQRASEQAADAEEQASEFAREED